jgi:hypothetical protein
MDLLVVSQMSSPIVAVASSLTFSKLLGSSMSGVCSQILFEISEGKPPTAIEGKLQASLPDSSVSERHLLIVGNVGHLFHSKIRKSGLFQI